MRLFAKCRSCKKEFKLDKTYRDRPDLIADLGEYFNLGCKECGKRAEFHANDITAKESFSINLIGTTFGIGVIVLTTIFAWNQGFITNIGFIFGVGIIAASNGSMLTSNVNGFNKYRVTRNPK